jgi:hypothetical protein
VVTGVVRVKRKRGVAKPLTATIPFFLERDRNVRVRGQSNFVTLDLGNESCRYIMMVALVRALPAVGLDQLDAVFLDAVHGADVNTIRSNHFHVCFDRAAVYHYLLP